MAALFTWLAGIIGGIIVEDVIRSIITVALAAFGISTDTTTFELPTESSTPTNIAAEIVLSLGDRCIDEINCPSDTTSFELPTEVSTPTTIVAETDLGLGERFVDDNNCPNAPPPQLLAGIPAIQVGAINSKLRIGPSTSETRIGSVFPGERVEVLEVSRNALTTTTGTRCGHATKRKDGRQRRIPMREGTGLRRQLITQFANCHRNLFQET